ncbi:hypothetical protein ACTMU2_37140 [Cupriavidus basilensis]
MLPTARRNCSCQIVRERGSTQKGGTPYRHADGGPVVSDDVSRDFVEAAMRAIVRAAARNGLHLMVHSVASLVECALAKRYEEIVEQGMTVSVDLTKSADAHWRGFAKVIGERVKALRRA